MWKKKSKYGVYTKVKQIYRYIFHVLNKKKLNIIHIYIILENSCQNQNKFKQ